MSRGGIGSRHDEGHVEGRARAEYLRRDSLSSSPSPLTARASAAESSTFAPLQFERAALGIVGCPALVATTTHVVPVRGAVRCILPDQLTGFADATHVLVVVATMSLTAGITPATVVPVSVHGAVPWIISRKARGRPGHRVTIRRLLLRARTGWRGSSVFVVAASRYSRLIGVGYFDS